MHLHKLWILFLLGLFASDDSFAQSIVSPTISYSGHNSVANSHYFGSTTGEFFITSEALGSFVFVQGFQYIPNYGYPLCLQITSPLPQGEGTLREAVGCARSGDTVSVDMSLHGQFLFLDLPVIIIDKQITVVSAQPVTFRNLNPTNSMVLLESLDELLIQGINLSGSSNGELIFSTTGGNSGIEILNAELERFSILDN